MYIPIRNKSEPERFLIFIDSLNYYNLKKKHVNPSVFHHIIYTDQLIPICICHGYNIVSGGS